MKKIFYSPALLLGISLLLLSGGQWILFRLTLASAEDRTAGIAYHALQQVLVHAHQMNDDLTLQEAIQGLSRAPGFLFACVLDLDSKVIAHTQPVQLGKIFTRPSHHRGAVKAFILRDGEAPWGRLILGMSDRFLRMKSQVEAALLTGWNLCVWGPVFWMVNRHRNERALNQKHKDVLQFQCDELKRELERLHLAQESQRARGNAWMDSALERITHAALYLDSTQRVAACNGAGRKRLGIADAQPWRGLSWQDFPALSAGGDVLQRSVERPGEAVHASLAGASAEFLSENAHGGTWILFN